MERFKEIRITKCSYYTHRDLVNLILNFQEIQ